mgnify:CR=1 FL=1
MKILIITNEDEINDSSKTELLESFKKADSIVSELIFHTVSDIHNSLTILDSFNIIFCFSDTKNSIMSLFQNKKNILSFETSFNPFYDKQLNLLISGVSFNISELKTTSVSNKKLAWSLMQETIKLGKNLIDIPIIPVFTTPLDEKVISTPDDVLSSLPEEDDQDGSGTGQACNHCDPDAGIHDQESPSYQS